MNTLYYGDNLKVLREHIQDESVDLIYLDPPFNSNRSYNVLFKDESGNSSDAQITAFDDSWHWGETAERTYQDLIQNAPLAVAQMIGALREFIGSNQMMAYLVMMAARLVELHRVLKPTGSLYLHCDPTASHYLKILLDMIFGYQNFRNEIAWKRSTSGSSKSIAQRFGSDHDVLLYYVRSNQASFNKVFLPYPDEEIKKRFRRSDERGRYKDAELATYSAEKLDELRAENKLIINDSGKLRYKIYLDEIQGVLADDVWIDIPPINSQAAERLGYPTQKPLPLLERIINASSNPGDVVLDPFSGCGTCIAAAQKLGRQWIGIDITHLAIAMHKSRLKDMYGLEPKRDYQVIGEPEDLQGARQLAREDRYQFQWWALSLIEARPLGGSEGSKTGKKGADRGIDGAINFIEEKGAVKRALVQVKSGHVNAGMIRDLKGTLERENASIGVFITLEPPTREMLTEASSGGFYHSDLWDKDFPRVQILSVEDLFNGAEVRIPPTPRGSEAFKQAEKVKKQSPQQDELKF